MRSIRRACFACVVAAVAMLPLHADAQTEPRSQDTFFTFSQPVELPGTTLPAGTYLFRLADSESNRHIVQVLSEDRQQLHTTLLAIPSYSIEKPSDEPEVRFMEGPEAGPQAVKMWFYPGRTTGHEFIYPREQAMRLAQRTDESVLTTRTETEVADVTDEEMTRIDREGRDAAVDVSGQRLPESARTETGRMADADDRARTEQAQAQPQPRAEPEARAQAQPQPQPQAQPRQEWDDTRTELPRTASMLPLLAVLGLGSLVGSRWLRRSRRPRL